MIMGISFRKFFKKDRKEYPWPTDSANWDKLYPGLKVPIHAPHLYIRKSAETDDYSRKIVESKDTNLSDFFLPELRPIFKERFSETDLIIVVPSSKEHHFSPTLVSIARKLSEENSIKNENIIERIKSIEKCSHTAKLQDRFNHIQGTMKIKRDLQESETKILLIDDTKASGVNLLECSKILHDNVPFNYLNIGALCLGINKKGWEYD